MEVPVPSSLKRRAEEVIHDLLPKKSKERSNVEYEKFCSWLETENVDLECRRGTVFQNSRPTRSRFPSYRQILHGGFGEANGGSYTLEMETYPFTEENIQVRITQNEIVIEGRMEEKMGDDFMMYVFTKKCRPPVEVDLSSIEYKFLNNKLVLSARTNK